MVSQKVGQVAELVNSLEAASKKSKSEGKRTFSCKKSTFPVAHSDNISVDSWKFLDHEYKRRDLPTYARGLFTTRRKDGTPEIVVRGYDKFFNVDETDSTRWRSIETQTRGPYELSVKENGCIIFISGLEDDTLLVCSKHSTGTRADVQVSHAQAGEQWVEHHVHAVGKTAKDLSRELRRMNATAVGELCDDHFEEHVLAYDEAASGIYLHGINFNVPYFATLPGSDVHQFADTWGFKKANYVVFQDLQSAKGFLDQCAETGTWDGRETEGFVIRCQRTDEDGVYRDWFFKYKFEEPYLMYRQWRECTKAVIAGKVPKIKKHHKITEEYLQFARRQLAKNPKLAKLYNQNHGIISMRENFLHERGLKGSEIIAMEESEPQGQEVYNNLVLVPVASLGCGKTTVAVALIKLFGWGHVQNDNIPKMKNKKKKFILEVTNALGERPAVIADRNNHMRHERGQIFEDVQEIIPNAKFVALHYVHEPKSAMLPGIREVTRRRVLDRGDNHQTIRAGTKDSSEVVGIMEGFLGRFEGVNTERDPDNYFDQVIDLDVAASSRENLEKVVNALHASFPRLVERVPTAQELDDALNAAMHDYHVEQDLSHTYGPPGKQQNQKNKKNSKDNNNSKDKSPAALPSPETLAKKIEYFKITIPTAEITHLLHSLFPSSTPAEKARLYHHLVNSRRVQPTFHVTLIHRASQKDNPQIWDQYAKAYLGKMHENGSSNSNNNNSAPSSPSETTPILGPARIRLERLVWDSRIMAFVARILPVEDGGDCWPCANALPHVTVGTAAPEVKPKESNTLLSKWLQVGSGGETGIWEAEVPGVKVVQGSVGVVMSR